MAILLRTCMHTFFRCFLPFVNICIGGRLLCGGYVGGIHLDPDVKGFYAYLLAAGTPSAHLYSCPDEDENDYTKTNVLHYCRIHRIHTFHTMRILRISHS